MWSLGQLKSRTQFSTAVKGGTPIADSSIPSQRREVSESVSAAIPVLEGSGIGAGPSSSTVELQRGPPDRVTSPFSYHGGSTFPPGVVRKILVKDVGLTEEQSLKLLGKETS